MNKKLYLTGIILLLVYVLAVVIRAGVCLYHQAKYEVFPFTGESALLYRYALFAAEGKDIPQIDYMAQYPEGLPVSHHISVGVELFMGYVYRILFQRAIDFHSFARYFTPFFFCLGVIGIYLVAGHVLEDEFAGITSALFYAVGMPAVIRSTGQEFSRENFALPLIIFHLWFFLKALAGGKSKATFLFNSVAAALLLALALIWWEGTQIYFYIFVIFAGWSYLFKETDAQIFKVFGIQIFFCFLAGAGIPYLRSHYFIISYPMLVSFSLLLSVFGGHRNFNIVSADEAGLKQGTRVISPPKSGYRYKRIVFLLLTACLITAAILLGRYTKTYAHVQTVLFYKLLFLNNKPLDPNLLPYEARILWVPDLLKPGWSRIFFYFSTMLVLGFFSIAVIIYRFLKKQMCRGEGLLVLGLASTFVLYLFLNRVHVYFVIFLCVFMGYGGWFLKKKAGKIYIVWPLLAGLCLFFETAKVAAYTDVMGVPAEYQALWDSISWVKNNTAKDAVILSHFNVSPPFLNYAGRAIVLHPKFESSDIRRKVKDYAFALFSEDKDEFYNFCVRNKVIYFVYPAGTFSEKSDCGWRYITATPVTAEKSAAYKFEYRPYGQDRFVLVYKNWKYKIYKVCTPEEIRRAREYFAAATVLLEEGRYDQAVAGYKKALEIYPYYVDAAVKLGAAYYRLGFKDKANEQWKKVFQIEKEKPR